MTDIRFYKLSAVPVSWQPNAVYYIDNGTQFEEYVTDSAGVPARQYAPSGWAKYQHTGAPQSIVANVSSPLVNDAGITLDAQKPSDVTSFYAGGKIVGRSGDSIGAQLSMIFTPSSGLATSFWYWVDIGIGQPLFEKRFSIDQGAGVPHAVSGFFSPYTLNTWQANGGQITVQSDGPGEVTGQDYVIHRLHKARAL